MKMILINGILEVIVLGAPIASAEDLVPVGLQKQLFVDDYVIAQKHNVIRELGQPEKLGVVMKPSVPTDFGPVKKFRAIHHDILDFYVR